MITFEFPIFLLTERIIEKIPKMFLPWCSIYMNIVHITIHVQWYTVHNQVEGEKHPIYRGVNGLGYTLTLWK